MPFHTIPHCSGTGQVFQAFHSVPPLQSTVEHLPLLQMTCSSKQSPYTRSVLRPPWCALFCDSGSLRACPATHVNFCPLGGITTPPYRGGSDKETKCD